MIKNSENINEDRAAATVLTKVRKKKCDLEIDEIFYPQLLSQTNDDYQYTSTEFEWLLDMVNFTLQVKK